MYFPTDSRHVYWHQLCSFSPIYSFNRMKQSECGQGLLKKTISIPILHFMLLYICDALTFQNMATFLIASLRLNLKEIDTIDTARSASYLDLYIEIDCKA